jgi:hypothetical protein
VERGPAAPAAAPVYLVVPGYEILDELGRGGMGVVYKARQLKADRLVALKMIRAVEHAGVQDRLRFQIEAEAVARLQHPNIVQLFEVGEVGGQPFFSLEFCGGGTLTQLLKKGALAPREAAELIEILARAIHYAHLRGVVHRDLKPGNVLLSFSRDPVGERGPTRSPAGSRPNEAVPKITDFGLAKRLDAEARDVSWTGTVLGTPSYMAPEQAAGKVRDTGPGADVYSLGALLYECLTQRPPFVGATNLDTLHQVLHNEPVPPSRRAGKVPRDLETICLKCLRKQPEERYSDAEALADDLARFRAGEPVRARPVGRLERAVRWARRNPALAAAVALLICAAGLASWFAVDANRQAIETRRANVELDKTVGELSEKRDRLEGTLARTCLSPLAMRPGPLIDAEIAALEQVATQRREPLASRFVREALTDSTWTPGFAARAEYAWQAALGLDRKRRTEAEQLLVAELRATKSAGQRHDVALAAAALGDLSPETTATTATALARSMAETSDPDLLTRLAASLAALAARMAPQDSAAVCAQGGAALAEALGKTTDPYAGFGLREALPALADRMTPKEAAHVASLVERAMSQRTQSSALVGLAMTLSTLAARMEPSEAAAMLTQVKAAEPEVRHALGNGLAAVAGRMAPKDAVTTLTRALGQSSDWPGKMPLAGALSAAAARLEPHEAVAALAQAVDQTRNNQARAVLAAGLSAAAARLEPREAAAALTRAIGQTRDEAALKHLALGLSAAADRLVPEEAAALCGPPAAVLIQVLAGTTDPNRLEHLTPGLAALAAHLDRAQAADGAAALIQAMGRTTDPWAPAHLAQGLSAVAARLERKEAAELCGPAAVALTEAISKEVWLGVLHRQTAAVPALAARLESKQVAVMCRSVVAALTQAMVRNHDRDARRGLGDDLSAVVACMGPKDAAATLVEMMAQVTDDGVKERLTYALSGVAPRLEPAEAAEVCNSAVAALADTVGSGIQNRNAETRAAALSALAFRMAPKRAADVLARATAEATDPLALAQLAHGLSGVAARLERKAAADLCGPAAAKLVRSMSEEVGPYGLYRQVQGLRALAAHLHQRDVVDTAATLTRAMEKTTNPNLAIGLAVLAAHLDPKEAAELCAPAVAKLTLAMNKTTDGNVLRELAYGMGPPAAQVEPEAAAATIFRAFAKTADPHARASLAQGLAAVLARETSDTSSQRRVALAGTVAGLTNPDSLRVPGVLAANAAGLHPALAPLPLPLSAQTLVDILKHPLCVGEARRLVLQQLGRHYGRTFPDQWEFARFAEEKQLDLDLLSPPRDRTLGKARR